MSKVEPSRVDEDCGPWRCVGNTWVRITPLVSVDSFYWNDTEPSPPHCLGGSTKSIKRFSITKNSRLVCFERSRIVLEDSADLGLDAQYN
jgi:hypothetical protein